MDIVDEINESEIVPDELINYKDDNLKENLGESKSTLIDNSKTIPSENKIIPKKVINPIMIQ